ncbi:MAG TPA: hypothetical protein VMV89_05525 [Candidatus Paceibacterota bacterium]|nr:hypothetical protein [Candidatus Paceibacterota bacterium]
MAIPDLPVNPGAPASTWNEDLIFEALADHARRRMLVALAAGGPRTAEDLQPVTGKRRDATLKHLVWLRKAGLVMQQENKRDGRKYLYALAPNLSLTRTDKGGTLDFGFLAVRW